MRKTLLKITIVAAALLCGLPASGQRSVSDSRFVNVEGGMPWNGRGFSVDVSYGRYLLDGYRDLRFSFDSYIKTTAATGAEYDAVQYLFGYDRMWRLWSTWNRVFSIYLGGGAFAGMESLDPRRVLTDGDRIEVSRHSFLYGVTAGLAAEVFVTPYVSITASGRPRVSGGSRYGQVFGNAELGVRLSF